MGDRGISTWDSRSHERNMGGVPLRFACESMHVSSCISQVERRDMGYLF
jgi:hypothetical protein